MSEEVDTDYNNGFFYEDTGEHDDWGDKD